MAGATKFVEPSSSAPEAVPRQRIGIIGAKSAVVVALLSVAAVFIVPNFVKDGKQVPESLPVAENEPPPTIPFQHIPVKLDFYNRHDVPLDLYWANNDQPEVKMATIAPGEVQQFHSYVRHIWIWRIESTQEYVKSFVVENDQVTDVFSKFESTHHEDYMKENGFPWINVYPRAPMVKWVADPVEIGHVVERTVSPGYYSTDSGVPADDSKITLTMKTLSNIPKIFVIDNFLSEDECDSIINDAEASGGMKRSGVKTSGEYIAARTSTNMWMGADHSKIVENIFRRGFNFMSVEFSLETWKNHSESLQVLSYEVSQEYQPHDDYFKPSDYPTYKAVQEGKNRYATLFLYLSDVEEGGETVFPRVGNQYVVDACTVPEGFRVPPKKGRAALFFTMLPDGNLDHNALHGGCPVIKGRKWAANFWFWDPVSGDAF